ncbi:hypothetical protein [Nocardia yunnanensis]|uniref:hypothetical protein n=1 Tax=Nocardia yunnanensis TaxID=2382165 RepID=UPI0013C4C43B|nr:hypothetical protein [Nocardia yunnanensis]
MTAEDSDTKRSKTTLSTLASTRERFAGFAEPDETVDQTLNRLMDIAASVKTRARTAWEIRKAAAKADPAAWETGGRLADMLADRANARRAARG